MQEPRLDDIDFDSVAACCDAKKIEKFIVLLKNDGNHFPELMQVCKERLSSLDKKLFRKMFPESIGFSEISSSKAILLEWEDELKKETFTKRDSISSLPPIRSSKKEISMFSPKVEDLGEIADCTESAKSEVLKGKEALKAGDFEEAEEYFNRAIAMDSSNTNALVGRASIRSQNKHFKAALDDYQRIISIEPSNAFAIYQRGRIRAQLGLLEEAMTDFNKSSQLTHDSDLCRQIADDVLSTKAAIENKHLSKKSESFTKVVIEEMSDDDEPVVTAKEPCEPCKQPTGLASRCNEESVFVGSDKVNVTRVKKRVIVEIVE